MKQAAIFLGCSAGYLNSLRAADARRLKHGEKIIGPVWVLAPYGVRYAPAALTEWLKAGSIPLGVMTSRRRPPRHPSTDTGPPTAT